MSILRPIWLSTLLLTLSMTQGHADFNGELLLAPPPANWDGGVPMLTDTGIERTWLRRYPRGAQSAEKVTITEISGNVETPPVALARAAIDGFAEGCPKRNVSTIERSKGAIGALASVTVQCPALSGVKDKSRFVLARAYVGEYNTYLVSRVWSGPAADPGSPANSPRSAAQWIGFFERISVCNTLYTACDPADAAIIHAHPRFKTMRALQVAAKPVVPRDRVLTAAAGFGELTGRAEACGEDISPLMSKVERMFLYVAINDKDAADAMDRFRGTKSTAAKQQAKQDRESCGAVLRSFREHPTRVSSFGRYIERFK